MPLAANFSLWDVEKIEVFLSLLLTGPLAVTVAAAHVVVPSTFLLFSLATLFQKHRQQVVSSLSSTVVMGS